MENATTDRTQELIAETVIAITNAKNAALAADAVTDPNLARQAEDSASEAAGIVTGLVVKLNDIAADKSTASHVVSEINAIIKDSHSIRSAGQTAARYARRRYERTEALKFYSRGDAPVATVRPAASVEKSNITFTRRVRKPPKA